VLCGGAVRLVHPGAHIPRAAVIRRAVQLARDAIPEVAERGRMDETPATIAPLAIDIGLRRGGESAEL
jgi:hypothetical protein